MKDLKSESVLTLHALLILSMAEVTEEMTEESTTSGRVERLQFEPKLYCTISTTCPLLLFQQRLRIS